jgi:hypothetical protein
VLVVFISVFKSTVSARFETLLALSVSNQYCRILFHMPTLHAYVSVLQSFCSKSHCGHWALFGHALKISLAPRQFTAVIHIIHFLIFVASVVLLTSMHAFLVALMGFPHPHL